MIKEIYCYQGKEERDVFHDMALTLAVVCCHFAERAMEVVETSVLSIV